MFFYSWHDIHNIFIHNMIMNWLHLQCNANSNSLMVVSQVAFTALAWEVTWGSFGLLPPPERSEVSIMTESKSVDDMPGCRPGYKNSLDRPSLPSVFLTNVRSLVNKMEWPHKVKSMAQQTELSEVLLHAEFYREVDQCTGSWWGCGANEPDTASHRLNKRLW